jgi:hypothetical protein
MLDNYPPDATHEQKGMPRSIHIVSDFHPNAMSPEMMSAYESGEINPHFGDSIPLDITPTDEANISRNSVTYGG